MPPKPLPGPTRLSQIVKHLQQEPVPSLPALSSLKLRYALRNDHFGARHFVKDDLPRIAYTNPSLKIVVDKMDKKTEDTLTPQMELVFIDGSQHKIDMEKKWSSAIFTELLELHAKLGRNIKTKPSEATRGQKGTIRTTPRQRNDNP
ncbi:hypothetical protein JB92DRAFT_3144999 [Gautieria morchelliformis]|nr:hypothetical protein JB92DRAFT_3144999 [Gautieria morchelliformis]